MLFNERYKQDFHIGNITERGFKEIWESQRYWEVMSRLASQEFDAQKMCGSLCLQHSVNKRLDRWIKEGKPSIPDMGDLPEHGEFV